MPVDMKELIDALCELCQEKNVRVCVLGSLKGGLLTGISAICGGILLGPVGLAIGGAIGGLGSAMAAKDSFESGVVVLRRLSDEKKQKLFNKIKFAFRKFGIQDLTMFATLLLSDSELQDVAMRVVKEFFQNEMYMSVKHN